MMSSSNDFPIDYIDFGGDLDSSSDVVYKRLTFIGASAVSLLCYEKPSELSNILQKNPKYQFVRRNDIISDIWSLSSTISRLDDLDEDSAPILAWSARLQVLFLGFRGSYSVKDAWTDIDVRQSSTASLASKFHSGFLLRAKFYSELIRQLAERYKVVVCGHSLGGAVATIATYHAITEDSDISFARNVWSTEVPTPDKDLQEEPVIDTSPRISVITFGAPSMMVLEQFGTTATPLKCFTKNFHHIINRDDIVPFILNQSTKKAKEMMEAAQKILAIWPDAKAFFGILLKFFEFWAESRQPFAHYGTIYLIDPVEGDSTGIIQCYAIITSRQIPQTPKVDLRFHSMDHYNRCLDKTLTDRKEFPELSIGISTALTSTQFYKEFLPLPETIKGCTGVVYPTRVVISCPLSPDLLQYCTKNVSFNINSKWKKDDICKSKKTFSRGGLDSSQISLEITYNMLPNTPGEALFDMADAIERTLHLHDSFGRVLPLEVSRLQRPQLNATHFQTTYESIRNAMIIAFADQIAKVQHLKRSGSQNHEMLVKAGVLTEDARITSEIIDSLVANATPSLIKKNFANASKIVEGIWNATDEISTLKDVGVSTKTTPNPVHCDDLQKLLDEIIESFKEKTKPPVGFFSAMLGGKPQGKDWETMETFSKVCESSTGITLFETLESFSQQFYGREVDSENRIDKASTQSSRVILIMRFCHTIILTQLDPPIDFCIKFGNLVISAVTSGTMSVGRSFLAASGWTYLSYFFGIYTGFLALNWVGLAMGYFMKHTVQVQEGFDKMLKVSIQILKIQISESSSPEVAITDLLEPDYQTSSERDTQEKWRKLLDQGLRNMTRKQTRNQQWAADKIHRSKHYPIATISWSKWLFDVAKIGKLRRMAIRQLYIGVEGTTGVGKSTLLTTLTAAPRETFNPGLTASCRTTEMQSYTPPGLATVFCDCPGSDDVNPEIRKMARLFRGLMNVIIFVVPFDQIRSKGTNAVFDEITYFIRENKQPRPFRILLGKADQVEYDDTLEDLTYKFTKLKKEAIQHISKEGKFAMNLKIRTLLRLNGTVVQSNETLHDIVHLYSTHAQMSMAEPKALSDCVQGTRRKVKDPDQHRHLSQLAERGLLWDIESLRQWLHNLAPGSVPTSRGRVFQHS
ncbi:hypothetical protein TWF506_004618 [Arthrobotrys conoides]|uniref:Fungal lipase-like domain-containing protein n=1 Tax=Arthrobotrys conoides TaxID=74498 RepID=A0AAN8MWA5_9PEZI